MVQMVFVLIEGDVIKIKRIILFSRMKLFFQCTIIDDQVKIIRGLKVVKEVTR